MVSLHSLGLSVQNFWAGETWTHDTGSTSHCGDLSNPFLCYNHDSMILSNYQFKSLACRRDCILDIVNLHTDRMSFIAIFSYNFLLYLSNWYSGLRAVYPEKVVKKVVKILQKNLEVKKKVVPLHSHLRKGGLNRDETQQQVHWKDWFTVQEASTEKIQFIEKR